MVKDEVLAKDEILDRAKGLIEYIRENYGSNTRVIISRNRIVVQQELVRIEDIKEC